MWARGRGRHKAETKLKRKRSEEGIQRPGSYARRPGSIFGAKMAFCSRTGQFLIRRRNKNVDFPSAVQSE
jgi:hypothetical protein